MKIPKTAFINIDLSINLDKWLTEDDKQSILENSKNQIAINAYIEQLIADHIDTQIKYDNIHIDLY